MFHAMRRKIKHNLLERWKVPHSPIPGLPSCIYDHFRHHGPITVVDIGAHAGQFTSSVEEFCGLYSAVLIEPIEELAKGLKAKFDNKIYQIFDCAVSDHSGEIEIQIFPNATYTSSLLSPDYSIEEMRHLIKGNTLLARCPVRTLDEIIAEVQLAMIDLIKIDVQGAEHLVLAGASHTLEKTGAVYTEVSFRPLYHGSSVFSDIYGMMNDRGFFLAALEPGFVAMTGELLQADALFLSR